MGDGRAYKCSKCGKEYSALTGVGFMFPSVFKELTEEIKNGKYGQKWKDLALSEKYVVVDAERYLYVCGKCDHWSTDYGLSLYAPVNTDKIANMSFGDKTVAELGYIPYVTNFRGFHILKRYVHKCEKCGAVMHKATNKEERDLPCPDCGGAPDPTYDNWICWD